ncbi:hypothetical protein L596_014220 [Steinernema carpocapsae]|uniref:Uncharacterized protein n=1 Tax=Steinernema carpocapsae TaxID=34508 RepID=A0A4U5NCE5_STECR|nr:hypothetical protein L596_014220 [Steinernema carpocapsae]
MALHDVAFRKSFSKRRMESDRSKPAAVNVSAAWIQLPQLSQQLLKGLGNLNFSKFSDLIIRVGCCSEGVHIHIQVGDSPLESAPKVQSRVNSAESESDTHSTKELPVQKPEVIDEGHLKQFLSLDEFEDEKLLVDKGVYCNLDDGNAKHVLISR